MSSRVGIEFAERDVPVPDDVQAACGFLGLDPLYLRLGTAVENHPGVVVARTPIGGTRVVDMPLAEQLPRIC